LITCRYDCNSKGIGRGKQKGTDNSECTNKLATLVMTAESRKENNNQLPNTWVVHPAPRILKVDK